VLVVDDEPNNRGWLKDLLTSVGFLVGEAASGEEAIRVWQEWRPQLILMDVRLPGMNGREATRKIRAAANDHGPVIIALTAGATAEEQENVMRAGVDDFLLKPVREAALWEKIQAHLKLDYVWADEDTSEGYEAVATLTPERGSELLAKVPAEILGRLHDAVLDGDKARLDQLLEGVRAHDLRAASALKELAEKYEYEALTSLLEASRRTAEVRKA
jgi:CheY-like chemotaxis protein